MSFKDLSLHGALLRALDDLNFTEPSPIQRDAIPPAMEGRDLIACSKTGSGKTAAFLLPILNRLIERKRGVTRVLVLTPTRELAAQIEEHLRLLGRHTNVRSAAVFGGVPIRPQEQAFRKGVDVIIATPGRLLDHMQHPYARLDGLEHLVLDEADRMLDMGFLPDIKRILKALPSQRQTMLFSATMPPPIVALTREMLKDPVAINIERQVAPPVGITHAVYSVPQTVKSSLLLHLLNKDEMESVVVFTRTKHRANRLAAYLEQHGISCARIHGNRSQSQRTLALAGFKNREYRVLVATDIAARGIDVDSLSHVVNFDVPNVPEDYIHRVGRTARAEATGDAVTFVSPEESSDLRAIEKALDKRIPRLSAPEFDVKEAPAQAPETPLRERSGGRNQPAARSKTTGNGSRPQGTKPVHSLDRNAPKRHSTGTAKPAAQSAAHKPLVMTVASMLDRPGDREKRASEPNPHVSPIRTLKHAVPAAAGGVRTERSNSGSTGRRRR